MANDEDMRMEKNGGEGGELRQRPEELRITESSNPGSSGLEAKRLGEVSYPFPITSQSRTMRIGEENGLAQGHMASCRPGPSPRFPTDGRKLFLGHMSNC